MHVLWWVQLWKLILPLWAKIDYVRVKIVVRDICRIPETAEGDIIPYIYDFHFEREVENVEVEPKIEIQAPAGQGGDQLNPKKGKTK
jgi:hypothetical protein